MTILINCTGKFCYGHGNFQNTEAATVGVFKSSTKFTGKDLCQSLFFNILVGLQFYSKETLTQVFSCELWEAFKTPFFKPLFLKIWKFVYGRGRPQLPDKKLFWKCLENIQEHICIGLQVTSSIKLRIRWIHVTIKIRCHKTSKISSCLHFSKAFLSWLICRGEVIFRRAYPLERCEKRGCERFLKSKVLCCLFCTI